jgi:hypothetical protein
MKPTTHTSIARQIMAGVTAIVISAAGAHADTPIFDINYESAGNLVGSGGTGTPGVNNANGTNTIIGTNPFSAGSGNYQQIAYTGTATGYTSASFVPDIGASWNALIGTPIPVGGVNYLNLNGGFDIFARPVATTGTNNVGFRPVDVAFNVGQLNGIRFIFNAQANGQLALELLSRDNGSTGANAFNTVPGSFNSTKYSQASLGNQFTVGEVTHTGFTYSTNPLTGEITMKVFAQAGTDSIDTTNTVVGTGGLVHLSTFYGSADELTGTLTNWTQASTAGAGNPSTWDYDSARLYSGEVSQFDALPVPEPSTIGIAIAALLGLAALHKRKLARS